MRTMTVREDTGGRKTKVTARKTFRRASGEWVALVDENEFRKARDYVCQGIKNCTLQHLHVQADLDDDGKEYMVVNR